MRGLALLVLLVASCVPPHTVSSRMRRGPIWAQPGTHRVFAWSFRERQRSSSAFETDHSRDDKPIEWRSSTSTDIDRVRVDVIDPSTGASFSLAEYDGEVQPLFWDGAREILWVSDRFGVVTGLTRTEHVRPGRGGFAAGRNPLPFVSDPAGHVYDLATGRQVDIGRAASAGSSALDGSVLRFTSITDDYGTLAVTQTSIDWASPTPVRAEIAYRTPKLWEPGFREATAISADGRRVVDIATTQGRTTLVVHDLAMGAIIARIPVMSLQPPTSGGAKPRLVALGADRFAYLVAAERRGDDTQCYRGMTIAVAEAVAHPFPDGLCVRGIEGAEGRAWVSTDRGSAYIDAHGKLLAIGTTLNKPLAIGPSMIAYAMTAEAGGVDVVAFDFATAERTTLGHHAARNDTLINASPGAVTFAAGSRIITDVVSGPPIAVDLPAL